MKVEELERTARLLSSLEYRAFGFGADPVDFAERLKEHRARAPARSRVLLDVAQRVLFVDYLTHVIGWEVEDADQASGDDLRFSRNLDSLEIYLLCTCIDTLAIEDSSAGDGHTRGFVRFFAGLPEFLTNATAENVILIRGAYWTAGGRAKAAEWASLSTDIRIERIAKAYWWSRRRSFYTHRSHEYVRALPSHLRRSIESGRLASSIGDSGWGVTLLWSTSNPDKVRYSVLIRMPMDETFLLRASLAAYVVTELLGYSANSDYLSEFIQYRKALASAYAFLREMSHNRHHLDVLTNPSVLVDDNLYQQAPVSRFSCSAAERLLSAYATFADSWREHIAHYLHLLEDLNRMIESYNASSNARSEWLARQQALVRFSTDLSSTGLCGQARTIQRRLHSSMKRQIESGQVLYRYGDLLSSEHSNECRNTEPSEGKASA